jgi:CheY-like chemotaxis protein
VLLDLRMPEMDGLEVLSTLVMEHPETPVIVVSGHGTMTDAVQALRRGAWDFFSKPLPDKEILVHAARRGIERSALLRENREYSQSLRDTNQRLSAALSELRSDEQGARQLQFQLLPEDGLRLGPLSCERRLFPSQQLSGDFLDYFALNERYAGLYLADVAGHGTASALVTAILTTLVGKYREALRSRGDETILHPQLLLRGLDLSRRQQWPRRVRRADRRRGSVCHRAPTHHAGSTPRAGSSQRSWTPRVRVGGRLPRARHELGTRVAVAGTRHDHRNKSLEYR